jgi:hypothetical protein
MKNEAAPAKFQGANSPALGSMPFRGSELQLRHTSRREAPTARGAFPASFQRTQPPASSAASPEESTFPHRAGFLFASVQHQASSLWVFSPQLTRHSRTNGMPLNSLKTKEPFPDDASQHCAPFAPQNPLRFPPHPGPQLPLPAPLSQFGNNPAPAKNHG